MFKKPKVLMVTPNQHWNKPTTWSLHPYGVCLLIAIIKGISKNSTFAGSRELAALKTNELQFALFLKA
ncbi:MAG: hypothetical protein HOI47_26785 [Candidatus Scalindua sp.]|nr:hypothetical protein [Candidatus Scalindua sp.]